MLNRARFWGMNAVMSEESGKDLYDIGAASRLTGLSAPNLRIWEKRYSLVSPRRTASQRRMYTAEDIKRLTLLKGLVDRGHSIGSIAQLGTAELESRLREDMRLSGASNTLVTDGPCRLLIVGSELQALLEGCEQELGNVEVVSVSDDLEAALASGAATSADLILVQCPTLFPDTVDKVQKLVSLTGAFRAIVVYRFAQRGTEELLRRGVECLAALRAPVGVEELRLVCQAEVGLKGRDGEGEGEVVEKPGEPSPGDVPPRRYSDRQLARIAQASTVVECECPHHLANVVRTLLAFEAYSAECESRNPEDAALHQDLYRSTAAARAQMESALQRLVKAEGIKV